MRLQKSKAKREMLFSLFIFLWMSDDLLSFPLAFTFSILIQADTFPHTSHDGCGDAIDTHATHLESAGQHRKSQGWNEADGPFMY